jgi:TRAP-type mannitol/chloroaromatic compound transport system permease small subunit
LLRDLRRRFLDLFYVIADRVYRGQQLKWNAASPGRVTAAALPRISRQPSRAAPPGYTSPIGASSPAAWRAQALGKSHSQSIDDLGAQTLRRNIVGFLLRLSRAIDALNDRVGRFVSWAVLAAVLVSAANASVRYAFDVSSNAWLELQWYLFSAVFLLCAGYTLRHNEHVRIDVIHSHLSPRLRAWTDLLGGLLFLLPMAVLIMVLSWPVLVESFVRQEVSSDAGGLLRWPSKLLIPVGFLLLQGLSEIIKRIAFLLGRIPDPLEHHREPTAEEFLKGAVE